MAWTPSAADVHAVIPQRVPGGFTAVSIPTVAQVEAKAALVQREVQSYLGQANVVEAGDDEELAKFTAATGTAARVELSLYPEQSSKDGSAYAEIWADYRQLAAQLYYAVHGTWPTHFIDELPPADERPSKALGQAYMPENTWVGQQGF